jgi:hypothetical protein
MINQKKVGSVCRAELGSITCAEVGSVSRGQVGSVLTEFPEIPAIPCLIYLKNKLPLSIDILKKTHHSN